MKKSMTRELKAYARVLLNGKHGFFAFVTLFLFLVNFVMNTLLDSVFPGGGALNLLLELVCSVLINVIFYLLLIGQKRLYLNVCRDEVFGTNDLFASFTGHPEQIAIYSVLQFFLQSLLLYNGGLWILIGIWNAASLRTALLLFAAALAGSIFLIWIQLILSFVLYIFVDEPWITAKEAVKKSVSLMNGNKWKLFRLQLSFLGMDLLCLLSFGIGSLFVEPYQGITETLFYLEVTGQGSFHQYNTGEYM